MWYKSVNSVCAVLVQVTSHDAQKEREKKHTIKKGETTKLKKKRQRGKKREKHEP